MSTILIAEDEPPIAELIEMVLTAEGHHCTLAGDGKQAADLLAEQHFDLLLLDIMLPQIDGYALFHYSEHLGIPAVFVTAKADLADRVKGLRMGGIDYITKPFEPEELAARVAGALGRNGRKGLLQVAGVTLDPKNRRVCQNKRPISLSPLEFDLLELFLRHPGATLSRDYLYETVWGGELPPETRTLDTHVQRLRGKLGWQRRIVTVYARGYRLEAEL